MNFLHHCACIITTAAIPLKQNNPFAVEAYNFLLGRGIEIVDYIDIEFEEPTKLFNYDLVFILGIDEGVFDYSDTMGLSITNHILFPHYDMFSEKVTDLENELTVQFFRDYISIFRLKVGVCKNDV